MAPPLSLADLKVNDTAEIVDIHECQNWAHITYDGNYPGDGDKMPIKLLECDHQRKTICNRIKCHRQKHFKLKCKYYNKRLSDLGLIPKTQIRILRKAVGCGPIEIQFRDTILVIGRGLANKIQVKKLHG